MADIMNGIKATGAAITTAGRPSIDDVVHAFRWILGRDPVSFDTIARRCNSAKGRAGLRTSLLLSSEFLGKFDELRIEDLSQRSGGSLPWMPADTSRIVFVHIPKTGGTTLHTQLSVAVGADRVCRSRHNDLSLRTGAELASARLFSGHYDRQCLSFVPGANTQVITLLREPRQRVRSLYAYLRAHKESLIASKKLELAAAARRYDFNDFLQAALEINPAAVDNTYVRAFGGRLPLQRWERRTAAGWPQTLSELDASVDELVHRACDFVNSMAAVGILEEFDTSLAVLFNAIGLPVPQAYEIEQRTADLVENHENFESVPTSLDSDGEELLSRLTMFDQVIYELGRSLLASKADQGMAA